MAIERRDGVIILEAGEFERLHNAHGKMTYSPAGLADNYILGNAANKITLHIPLADALKVVDSFVAALPAAHYQGLIN